MGWRLNSPCGCCGDTPVFLADFLVFTYNFGAADGRDLDTRTQITAPFVSSIAGWCKTSGQAPYLFWGSDNMGTGVEASYVDLQAVLATYPAAPLLDVSLRAFWYAARYLGNMSVDVKAYLGGTMSHIDFGFVNTGGTLTASLSFARNVTVASSSCQDGQLLGTARYDFAAHTLVMV